MKLIKIAEQLKLERQKNEQNTAMIKKNQADLDYLAMMSNVSLEDDLMSDEQEVMDE